MFQIDYFRFLVVTVWHIESAWAFAPQAPEAHLVKIHEPLRCPVAVEFGPHGVVEFFFVIFCFMRRNQLCDPLV